MFPRNFSQPRTADKHRPAAGKLWLAGTAALLFSMAAGILFGSVSLAPSEVWSALHGQASPGALSIVLDLRLPRVLMAAGAGSALALAGLSFQTVLRNPLAEPYILGISGGAAVGVLLAALTGLSGWGSHICAFLGGMLTLAFVWFWGGRCSTTGLLLSGVMINAFCGALILFLLSLLNPGEAGSVLFWFLGDLGGCSLSGALLALALLIPGCLLLSCAGHGMNLLLLGEETAQSLGVPVRALTLAFLIVSSLMVSLVVAAVGPLGFVGLIVPQALRRVLGGDHRRLAPASLLFGAAFMVLCDMCARCLPEQGELPVGVLTALVGAPLFILLLRKVS